VSSQRLDFRPATCDISARPGSDLSFTVLVTGTGYVAAPTVTCDIGGQTPTTTVALNSTYDAVLVSISLTDTQTTAIGAHAAAWSLGFTSGSITTPIVVGSYVGSTAGNSSQGMQVGVALRAGSINVQVLSAGPFLPFADSGSTGNMAIGSGAGLLADPVDTYGNLAVGLNALASNVDSSGNTALGMHAMRLFTTGGDNVAVGTYTLENNTSGTGNTAVGFRSQRLSNTAGNNTSVGDSALYSIVAGGDGNVAVGYVCAEYMTTGTRNVAIGRAALQNTPSPDDTIAIGHGAIGTSTGSPDRVVAIGTSAAVVTTGSDSVAIGYQALLLNTSGFRLTAIGGDAGNVNTTGVGNTYIGWGAGTAGSKVDAAASTAIGYLALVTKDNQMVLGGTNVTETLLRGLVCVDGNTVSYPALKRSGTTIQARTATESTFARFQGELQTSANAVSASGLTPTHTVVLYDAAGQAYRVPCLV
jgi:trimeric autotransporter adhesin